MKKRIAIILAFLIALSALGMMGAACPTKDEVNEALATDILAETVKLYKNVTGKDLPPVIADKLNKELVAKVAKGTGYLGITTFVCDFIYAQTGVQLPADLLAIAIKAAFLVYGLL